MKCSEVRHHLSAYFDGELATQSRGAVRTHLETCPDCSAGLSRLRRLSGLAKELPDPAPGDMWSVIERQLVEDKVLPAERPVIPIRYGRFTWRWAANIAAVAAALVIGVYLLSDRSGKPIAQPEMALNLAQYVDEFRIDPERAQNTLLKQYVGKPVQAENAFKLVNYKPLAPAELPGGLVRTAMYEVEMPCCKCIQCVYRRADGGSLAVFEHAGDEPPCFGKKCTMNANCGDKEACLVECEGQLVVSWKEGERFITLVGVKDQEEADRLIPAFAQTNS
jgi:Putative zinc-finger